MPPSIKLSVLYDRSQSIRESVRDVQISLLLALALVVGVIFVFLRSARATLIPSLALPMSIIGTFALMYVFGYNLDNLSLMALTLCVGFVVDDAIVMLENITRHMEMGKPRMQATLDGSKEIGFTIVSMTLSLAAVFIPVLFMGGILGRLLHEFAVTIIVAVLLSGFVSLTLTPLLCSRMLTDRARRGPRPRLRASPGGCSTACSPVTGRALALALGAPAAHDGWRSARSSSQPAFLFTYMPKGFLPSDDVGQIFVFTEAAQDISFDAMSNLQRQVAEIARRNPHVEGVMSFVGAGGSGGSLNSGRLFVTLKPRGERPTADVVVQELRPALTSVPGIKAFVQNVPAIRLGQLTKSLYQYTLQASDTTELYEWAPKVEEKLRALPGLVDVTSDLQITQPQVTVEIDRNRASALGVSAQEVENTLYDAYGSRQVSTIYAPTNQYWVVMELLRASRPIPRRCRCYTCARTPVRSCRSIPWQAQADDRPAGDHASRATPVGDDLLRPETWRRVVAGDRGDPRRTAAMRCRRRSTARSRATRRRSSRRSPEWASCSRWPSSSSISCSGSCTRASSTRFTILSGLPTAAFGALLTLWLFRIDLNMYAFVGMIMLVGIVKKNAIMMIDFAIEAQRKENQSRRGRDLPGLRDAIPSDHDDDDGRADGQPADRARARRWRRGAAPARAGRRRRSGRVASADALHHAGDLHLLRALSAVAWHVATVQPVAEAGHRKRPTLPRIERVATACRHDRFGVTS